MIHALLRTRGKEFRQRRWGKGIDKNTLLSSVIRECNVLVSAWSKVSVELNKCELLRRSLSKRVFYVTGMQLGNSIKMLGSSNLFRDFAHCLSFLKWQKSLT